MNRLTTLLLSVLMASLTACVVQQPERQPYTPTLDADVEKAANEWLAAVDAGHYESAVKMMAQRVTESGSGGIMSYLKMYRAPLGANLSRTVARLQHRTRVATLPDGDYQLVAYRSKFLHKEKAVEGLILSVEGGHWVVTSYIFL